MIYDLIYDNKEKIGKLLFSISLLVFFYMFFSPLTQAYIHIDEHFTVNLLNLPFADFFNKMAHDVHPPLYYFICLFVGFILNLFNLPVDYFTISKLVSVVSYGLLLVVAATKIKNDYGWFEAGLFVFLIATMSGFFIQFVTSRMYGWAVLLLVLSFLYLKDVLYKSDAKSWALFIIFTMACAYTHYYLVFTVGFMYLVIIVDLIRNKKFNLSQLKKLILAIIASAIIYIPELYVLSIQMSSSRGNASSTKSLFDLISYVAIGNYQSLKFDVITFKVITLLFIIAIVCIAVARYWYSHQDEENFILIGLGLYLLTLFAGYFIIPLVFGGLTGKYLLPVIGIFWLSASLLFGRLENRKVLTLCLIVVLLLCCVGILYNADQTTKLYDKGIEEEKVLNAINNDSNVIIYQYGNIYHNYHPALNKTNKSYSINEVSDSNVTHEKNISKILDDNPGKNVYVIKPVSNKKDKNFGKNITSETVFKGTYSILKLEKKNADKNG